jgi:HK97 gp10 family phage protein
MMPLSLLEMAGALAAAEVAIHANARAALETVAQRVEKTAKAEFGVYQDAVGPFPEWAELAESTKEDRVAKGYAENNPLLRDGTLRDSISHDVKDLTATIGSTSQIMEYQEFGTSRIPPRPVLGPAVIHNHDAIIGGLGGAVVRGLVGNQRIHASLGYDDTLSGNDSP